LRAAWYERQGPASETLVVGEMPDVHPGPGEVRIAVSVSGLSPGDVKKRIGWQGSDMAYPRVIPHSDGAGTIDQVGEGVDAARIGQSVWCYGAQSYRPFGTAAQFVAVPSELSAAIRAVAPDGVNRIAEVDFSAHVDIDAEVLAIGGVISSYYSSADRPTLPYWPLGFADTTLRLLGSDDFAPPVKADAARELTAALLDGTLRSVIAARVPLSEIARAHELVERGVDGRVLVMIDNVT
jgi:NADPH:quinone reductase-like Zn-dependent oxidoreductase